MRIMIQAQQEPPATAGSSGTQVVQLQPTGTEGADPPAPEPPSLHLSAPPGPRAIVETALDASPPTTPRRASEQPGDGQLALTADTGDAEVAAGLSQPDPTVSGDATSAYMLSALARGRVASSLEPCESAFCLLQLLQGRERSSFTGALQLLSASPRPMQQDRTLTSRTSRSRLLTSISVLTARAPRDRKDRRPLGAVRSLMVDRRGTALESKTHARGQNPSGVRRYFRHGEGFLTVDSSGPGPGADGCKPAQALMQIPDLSCRMRSRGWARLRYREGKHLQKRKQRLQLPTAALLVWILLLVIHAACWRAQAFLMSHLALPYRCLPPSYIKQL